MYECARISIKLTVLFSFYYVIFFPLTHFKAKVKKKNFIEDFDACGSIDASLRIRNRFVVVAKIPEAQTNLWELMQHRESHLRNGVFEFC